VTAARKNALYSDTFRLAVPVRKDRKHGWKQHATCDSLLYQVLGRYQHLATLNHGFVYEPPATTAKHIRRYGSNEAPSKRTIERIKVFARARGIIGEDMMGKSQPGHVVKGFYMASHDECCHILGGQHVFAPPVAVDLDGYSNATGTVPESGGKGWQCRTAVAPLSQEIAPNVASSVAFGVASSVALATTEADAEVRDAESARGNGMAFGMPSGRAVGESYPYEPYELQTKQDTESLAETPGSVLQRAHVSRSEIIATKNCDTTTDAMPKAAVDDSSSRKKDRADVLLTGARALVKNHGSIGIGLAAAIAATHLNDSNGEGQLPQSTRYYTKTADAKYMPEADIPFDGYLDGFYYDTIAEEGIDRLRRAAERRGLNLNRVLAQLETMQAELVRRETAA
jgi:hypothetical protein